MRATALRMKIGFALVLSSSTLGMVLPAAESEVGAWFGLYPSESSGRVTVTVESRNAGIQGWSLGVCHDPGAARIVDFSMSRELSTVLHGNPPDFVKCELAEDPVTGRAGIVEGVVLAYQELFVVPSRPGGFPVLDISYEILDGSTSEVGFCAGLSGVGAPVPLVLTRMGETLKPAKSPTSTLAPSAQNAWFSLVPSLSDGALTVYLEASQASVRGWSFGLCHDAAKARIASYAPSEDLLQANGGDPPEFYSCEEASGAAGAGIVQAVILSTTEPVALPVRAGGFPVLDLEYEAFGESSVFICEGLEGEGQPVAVAITTEDGQTLPSAKPAGSTLVPRTTASRLAYRVEPPESSEVVTVKLYSDGVAIQGWSFALCHLADSLEVVEMGSPGVVDVLLGGEPPEFIATELVSADPYVAVTQRVILGSPYEPVAIGPFPDGLPLLGIRYRVSREDSLKFCDRDPSGATSFENGVLVDGSQYVPWTRTGAKLVRGALATGFIRGDADVNGSVQLTDAVAILMSLFLGSGPLSCLDAADANDVARVDISDPIFILHYLFLGGPEPPAPFPGVGQDLNPESALGCERGL